MALTPCDCLACLEKQLTRLRNLAEAVRHWHHYTRHLLETESPAGEWYTPAEQRMIDALNEADR